MSVFGWLTDLFFAKEEMDRQNSKVIQTGSRAGGRVVRGDMCGGNMNVTNIKNIAEGSFIGGDLKIGTPDDNAIQIIENLAKMDLEIGGRVILNGKDVTTEYRELRGR